uniref:Uncharacterized protein n=1 Tax=Glossina brevipalpis TaxID=37001 RepID=A0A1A9W5W6_9MUSC
MEQMKLCSGRVSVLLLFILRSQKRTRFLKQGLLRKGFARVIQHNRSYKALYFLEHPISCAYKLKKLGLQTLKLGSNGACLSVNGQSTSLGYDGTGVEVIDLTPLISTSENYQAEIDTAVINEHHLPNSIKFFLNVCRPLVPKYGLGCPGGSAACMAKMDKVTGKPEEEQI